MAIDKYQQNLPLPDLTAGYPSIVHATNAKNQATMNGINNILGTARDILIDYEEQVQKANTLETDAMLTKVFTERNAEIQNSVKLGDTVGLVDREYQWSRDELEKIRKASKLNDRDFNTLYNTHTANYIKKIGTYQLAEGARYQQQAMETWSKTMQDNMATAPIGDLSAMSSFLENARQVYKSDPVKGREEITKAFKAQMQAWAYQDPRQALGWFEQNKGYLTQVFGSDIIEANKVFDAAEEDLRAEVRFGIAMEKHAMDKAEFAKKQYNEQAMSDFYNKVFTIGGEPGEWTDADVHTLMADPNISFSNKKAAGGMIEAVTNPVKETRYNNAYANQTMVSVWDGTFNQSKFIQDVSNNKYTPAQISRINAAREAGGKIGSNPELKIKFDLVNQYIDKTYGANKGLIAANPGLVAQLKQQIASDVLAMPEEKRVQALDFNNPSSYIVQLFNSNAPTSIQQSMRKQMDNDFSFTPLVIPGATSVGPIDGTVEKVNGQVVKVKPVRRPDESIQEYTARLRAWRNGDE